MQGVSKNLTLSLTENLVRSEREPHLAWYTDFQQKVKVFWFQIMPHLTLWSSTGYQQMNKASALYFRPMYIVYRSKHYNKIKLPFAPHSYKNILPKRWHWSVLGDHGNGFMCMGNGCLLKSGRLFGCSLDWQYIVGCHCVRNYQQTKLAAPSSDLSDWWPKVYLENNFRGRNISG